MNKKSRIVDRKCVFFSCLTKNSLDINFVSRMIPEHSKSFLEAHRIIPNRFRENSKFHENLNFSESQKNVSFKRKFAQTIESTQRLHRWIAFDLMKVGKLLRSETNTQILRYLHLCDQNLVRAVNRQPLLSARDDS